MDAPARHGQTALFFAAGEGHLEVARLLLEHGANANVHDGFFGQSARMKDYFGADFHRVFVAVKRAEQGRFFSRVTQLDYDWYLRNS